MTNKIRYIERICTTIKNILIDRTDGERDRVTILIDWRRGEDAHIKFKGWSSNEFKVETPIVGGDDDDI